MAYRRSNTTQEDRVNLNLLSEKISSIRRYVIEASDFLFKEIKSTISLTLAELNREHLRLQSLAISRGISMNEIPSELFLRFSTLKEAQSSLVKDFYDRFFPGNIEKFHRRIERLKNSKLRLKDKYRETKESKDKLREEYDELNRNCISLRNNNPAIVPNFISANPENQTFKDIRTEFLSKQNTRLTLEQQNILSNFDSIFTSSFSIDSTIIVNSDLHLDYSSSAQTLYYGYFSSDETRQGFGIQLTRDSKYEGFWYNDQPHGFGHMYNFEGTVLIGTWNDGTISGYCKILNIDGYNFEGFLLENGHKSGFGIEIRNDKSVFKGLFENDNKKFGTVQLFNGDIYKGEFVNNKMQGQGEYFWVDGRKYTGEWLDGRINGQGCIILPSGEKCEGRWKNNILKTPAGSVRSNLNNDLN